MGICQQLGGKGRDNRTGREAESLLKTLGSGAVSTIFGQELPETEVVQAVDLIYK